MVKKTNMVKRVENRSTRNIASRTILEHVHSSTPSFTRGGLDKRRFTLK